MTDQWQWWRDALAGKVAMINADEPASGFYETRSKSKTTGQIVRGIVAYWYDDAGKLCCKLGFGERAIMVDDLRARERWPFASKRPITREVYDAVRAGNGWPDENAAAAKDRQAATSDGQARSNSAPDPDTFEGVRDRIEDLAREAEKLIAAGAAKSKDACDQAADLSARLRDLETKADGLRSAEKKPHDDAAKAVQRKWAPLVLRADGMKARLKAVVVTPFLVAAAAAQQKAQAEAIQRGAPPETVATANPTAGSTSTVGLRSVTSAIVEDWPKALAYFAENVKVRELIQQLANAAARSGNCPDGCKLDTKQAAA